MNKTLDKQGEVKEGQQDGTRHAFAVEGTEVAKLP